MRSFRSLPLVETKYQKSKKSDAFVNWVAKIRCTFEGCEDLHDVSARRTADYIITENVDLEWKGRGYGSFIDLILVGVLSSEGVTWNTCVKTLSLIRCWWYYFSEKAWEKHWTARRFDRDFVPELGGDQDRSETWEWGEEGGCSLRWREHCRSWCSPCDGLLGRS